MFKLIKICKIICIVFAVSLVGLLVFSIFNRESLYGFDDIKQALYGRNYYIHEFFLNLAGAAFFYLFIKFVEKWCEKNEIE
jgi:hypothetical protein